MNYCDFLLNINKLFCDEAKIRTKKMEVFVVIGKAIDDALSTDNYEDLLNLAMRAAALIKMFQPFMDGNHRTALAVFGKILNEKGYSFDYDRALQDMSKGKLNLPTLYDETDSVTFPSKWVDYISGSLEGTFEIKKQI